MREVDAKSPAEEPRLYNSKIIENFLKLIRKQHPRVDVESIIARSGMERYQIEDEGHWFTQEQVDRFYESLVHETGDPGIAREAGRFDASPDGIGIVSRYIFGLAGPAKVYETIGKIAGNFTRSTRIDFKRIGKNQIELTVTPNPGVHEKKYQCENRMGYFDAIVAGFNYRLPRIEHPECVFEGGAACRYVISWRESMAAVWKRARNIAGAASLVGLLILVGLVPWLAFMNVAVIDAILLLLLSFLSEWFERRELSSAINNLRATNESYFENAERNYNQALMINEIGHVISSTGQTDAMLSKVMDILARRLDYDRGLIMLASEGGHSLEFRAGFGYGAALIEDIRRTRFNLDNVDSHGVFVLCYREQRPYLVNDVERLEGELSRHSLEFLRKLGTKSFICCPILYEDECLGVLAVDNLESKRPLLESDINLIMGVAPEIGLSVHSALMSEERERQFSSILRTLAASIDARDNLTAGHSEKVTEYAMAICDELELPREHTEAIRVASLLHDYGKIGIKDSILKKDGPLTPKEREEIKTHAVKTQDILERVNFRGVYRQVPFIAGCHHERIDGTGYPKGLKGEQIPLGARIIAVADFFEAITAKRHYHEPRPFGEAIMMLREEAGPHLDMSVVQAFINTLEKGKVRGPAF
jgi:HD-GYP domain-containing protein (c-di-GMP phosphodiesterase class II)